MDFDHLSLFYYATWGVLLGFYLITAFGFLVTGPRYKDVLGVNLYISLFFLIVAGISFLT